MVCAMVRLKAYRPRWLAVALVAGTLAGIALGAMQVASIRARGISPWYLYEDTSVGRAVGFFANADHMATLLLVTMPFLAAIVAAARSANMQRYSAVDRASRSASPSSILIGLALNGSLVGYGLALPVIAASAPDRRFHRRPSASVDALAGTVASSASVVALENSADRERNGSASMRRAPSSRAPSCLLDDIARRLATSCRWARASARSKASTRCTSDRSR